MGEQIFNAFDDLVQRRYDLFLVCGLDVPWRHDGIREFEEQRHWMHERYVERARSEVPDFDREHLYEAIRDFQKRSRRFGNVDDD